MSTLAVTRTETGRESWNVLRNVFFSVGGFVCLFCLFVFIGFVVDDFTHPGGTPVVEKDAEEDYLEPDGDGLTLEAAGPLKADLPSVSDGFDFLFPKLPEIGEDNHLPLVFDLSIATSPNPEDSRELLTGIKPVDTVVEEKESPDEFFSNGAIFSGGLNVVVAAIKQKEGKTDIWLACRHLGKGRISGEFDLKVIDNRGNEYTAFFEYGKKKSFYSSKVTVGNDPPDIGSLPSGFIWTQVIAVPNMPVSAPVSKIIITERRSSLDGSGASLLSGRGGIEMNFRNCRIPDFSMDIGQEFLISEREKRIIDKDFSYSVGKPEVRSAKNRDTGNEGIAVFVPVELKNNDYNEREATCFSFGCQLEDGRFAYSDRVFSSGTVHPRESYGAMSGLSKETFYPSVFYCPTFLSPMEDIAIRNIFLYRRNGGSFGEARFCGIIPLSEDLRKEMFKMVSKMKEGKTINQRVERR